MIKETISSVGTGGCEVVEWGPGACPGQGRENARVIERGFCPTISSVGTGGCEVVEWGPGAWPGRGAENARGVERRFCPTTPPRGQAPGPHSTTPPPPVPTQGDGRRPCSKKGQGERDGMSCPGCRTLRETGQYPIEI